jgi:hypothetical protein
LHIDGTEVVYRWVYFVCMQYAVLFLMGYVAFIVPDVPEEVSPTVHGSRFLLISTITNIAIMGPFN